MDVRSAGLSVGSRLRKPCLIPVVSIAILAACRGDLLTVPPPANAIDGMVLGDSAGAAALRAGAIGLFTHSVIWEQAGIAWTSVLSDEMYAGTSGQNWVFVDARSLGANGPTSFDPTYADLQLSRNQAEQAIAVLERHTTAVSDSEIGEMFATAGYVRVLLGESVCSGIPFSTVTPAGQITFGDPLPTDSVFAQAVVEFDSALAHASSASAVAMLASVGKGRALLDRGLYGEAGAAVSTVPQSFLYNLQLVSNQTSLFEVMAESRYYPAVADVKGTNGLNFVSAHDPRLPIDRLGASAVGASWIYPLKFPLNPASNDPVPLADGVEAGLITAEASLNGGDIPGWLAALNALRANFVALRGSYPADTSYHTLTPLSDPGTDTARVSLMFRERAFWQYGTMHRLGDLRRLVRRYGRSVASVFPTGAYVNGSASSVIAAYGTSVNFPIGAAEQGNPKFHGCLSLGA